MSHRDMSAKHFRYIRAYYEEAINCITAGIWVDSARSAVQRLRLWIRVTRHIYKTWTKVNYDLPSTRNPTQTMACFGAVFIRAFCVYVHCTLYKLGRFVLYIICCHCWKLRRWLKLATLIHGQPGASCVIWGNTLLATDQVCFIFDRFP